MEEVAMSVTIVPTDLGAKRLVVVVESGCCREVWLDGQELIEGEGYTLVDLDACADPDTDCEECPKKSLCPQWR
jgi:hypothetical protein